MSKYAHFWPKAPPEVKYLATDCDGDVIGFQDLPTVEGWMWWPPEGKPRGVFLGYHQYLVGNWRDSLEERPGGA
jgi:hypothetical protein